MKGLSIITSFLILILFLLQPVILGNKIYIDFENIVLGKSIYCNILLFLMFLSYLFLFIFIKQNKDIIFSFFVFLSFISILILFIFSIKLPFFDIKIELNIVELLLILFFIFNSILISICSIFQKQKNYFFLLFYRFLLFINILFLALYFIGNLNYKTLYQYIIVFSVIVFKIIVNFSYELKKSFNS